MRVGVHLPQFGRAAVPGGVPRAARLAEDLGFDDVWVSDHLVVPASQGYPPPYLYDPLMTLAFAAAVTEHVGIGTSVLVGPQYASPLALANSLASLDNLSGGRLTVGIGIGWSKAEYEALGAPWDHRGARLDEIIDLCRVAWHDDPATHQGRFYPFTDVRLLPKPLHEIPVWVGGTSERALGRAAARGDGYHGIGVSAEEAPALVARVRALRPDEGFVISLRLGWDQAKTDPAALAAVCDAYREAGIGHVEIAPERGDIDAWLAGMEATATALGLAPR